MKPSNLKDWKFVKTKVHDLSGIKDGSPENYYYQQTNGVYYPVASVRDMDAVPEKYRRI